MTTETLTRANKLNGRIAELQSMTLPARSQAMEDVRRRERLLETGDDEACIAAIDAYEKAVDDCLTAKLAALTTELESL